MSYRCGPTAIGSRASWGPISSPTVTDKPFDRPLSGNFDRIFNAFERTNAFEYVNTSIEKEERHIGHGDIVVNRRSSSSFERADCALAALKPSSEDEEFYREKILYSQARQLFPLQEDLADWINKTIGITYLTGENFLDVLDNGVELCQLAAVVHNRARDAVDQGLIVGPVPQIRGSCWVNAARRSFFSRDNTDNFISFCRDLGVHENLLFESDDLVLHNQPRQVILCLLEVARLASRYGLEPPGLVQLEREIALEERDSGLDSAMSGAAWQFRDCTPPGDKSIEPPPSTPDPTETQLSVAEVDNADAESTKSGGTVASTDSDVPLKPANELDKRVQLVTRLMERGCRCGAGRCSKLLKVKKVGEGRYNIAGRNVFIRLLKGRHMMVRVGGGWETLEHFLSRHEPCQVRLVTAGRRDLLPVPPQPSPPPPNPPTTPGADSPTSRRHSTNLPEGTDPPNSRRHSTNLPNNTDLSTSRRYSTNLPDSTDQSPSRKNSTNIPEGTDLSTSRKHSTNLPEGTAPITSRKHGTNLSPTSRKHSLTSASSKTSKDSLGTVSPVDSKASSLSGKISPIERVRAPKPGSGKSSPSDGRRTSIATKASSKNRSGLTLPLNDTKSPRLRKQSAPSSFSVPNTPTNRVAATPPADHRKSLTPTILNAPKKSRSMSLALQKEDPKKLFCGTDRLNQAKKKSISAASKPTESNTLSRKTRSQSLASTPVNDTKKTFNTNGFVKKTRSMSLANPVEFQPISNKIVSVSVAGMTQAAIEESIRLSLAATITDDCAKKPFLHIKAKYRSPPPREVPPR